MYIFEYNEWFIYLNVGLNVIYSCDGKDATLLNIFVKKT